jgi:hypothetical protein
MSLVDDISAARIVAALEQVGPGSNDFARTGR